MKGGCLAMDHGFAQFGGPRLDYFKYYPFYLAIAHAEPDRFIPCPQSFNQQHRNLPIRQPLNFLEPFTLTKVNKQNHSSNLVFPGSQSWFPRQQIPTMADTVTKKPKVAKTVEEGDAKDAAFLIGCIKAAVEGKILVCFFVSSLRTYAYTHVVASRNIHMLTSSLCTDQPRRSCCQCWNDERWFRPQQACWHQQEV